MIQQYSECAVKSYKINLDVWFFLLILWLNRFFKTNLNYFSLFPEIHEYTVLLEFYFMHWVLYKLNLFRNILMTLWTQFICRECDMESLSLDKLVLLANVILLLGSIYNTLLFLVYQIIHQLKSMLAFRNPVSCTSNLFKETDILHPLTC